MRAAYADQLGLPDPLEGLVIGERPEPSPPRGWEVVEVESASLNRHDLWMLKGVSVVPVKPPVILGCDGAGRSARGEDVVLYPVLGHGPDFYMLTDGVDGTFAPRVAVPSECLVRKPANLSFDEAACLPTTYLTAWSSLVTKARLRAGERLLVQGVSGGLSNACILVGKALGAHVTATSSRSDGLDFARSLGADEAVSSGEKLDESVDVVIDSVGAKTWSHSIGSLGYGGRMVVLGATTGIDAPAEIRFIFRKDLTVMGHKMGTLDEFEALCAFVEEKDLHPAIARVYEDLEGVRDALKAMAEGGPLGKLVIRPR